MKYYKIFAILLLSSFISFYSCNDKTNSQKKETTKPFKQVPLNNSSSQASQNAEGVWHYICSKGCAGGSSAAGNCGSCGSTLNHNQAYHTNANKTPTNNPLNQSNTVLGKNPAGVWHYTCQKGCTGGSGAAGNCVSCGGTLAHNQAYHQ